MFVSIGETLTTGPQPRGGRRTGQPVRKHSRLKGREGLFWRRTTRREARQIVDAAKRYNTAFKQRGDRRGPLGLIAIEVLDYLANLMDYRTGRLEPSYEFLMAKLNHSRDAIHRALVALRAHGFLDWLRRYVPSDNGGRGPQVKQTSNAYRLAAPAKAIRLLGRAGKPSPLPDDFSHAREQQRAALAAHLDTLDLVQRTLFEVDDNPLGKALARLAKGVMERGSDQRTESMI